MTQNLLRIFPENNEDHFEYTLSSCLSAYSRQYKDVFMILKNASLIKEALEFYNDDCVPLGSIIRYALLEYCFWNVKLGSKESTLSWVLDKRDTIYVEKVIEVIWELRFVSNEKLKTIWENILKIASANPEKYKKAVRCLSRFVDRTDELSDEYTRLFRISIARFEENDDEAYSFIRGVYHLADTNLKNAGTLVLETFRKAQLMPFFDSELHGFVEKLYKNNFRNVANDICLYVGDKGQLLLKELYDKYNN